MTDTLPPGQHRAGRVELQDLWTRAQKIFAQELRTGCLDRTVIGGLDRFVANWSASLSSQESAYYTWQESRRVVAMLLGYGDLPPQERTLAIRGALDVATGVIERMATFSITPETKPDARQASGPGREQVGGGAGKGGPSTHEDARAAGTGGPATQRDASSSTASPLVSSTGRTTPATRRPAQPRRRPAIQPGRLGLEDPIVGLKGVGKARASLLGKLGIERVRDLLFHFPRDYRDYRPVRRIADLMYGETASMVGTVEDVQVVPGPRQRFRTTARVRDESGALSATWFRYGYGGVRIVPNSRVAVAGTVSGFGSHLALEGPDWELADEDPLHTRRLVPVYPLTEGVSDYWLRELAASVVPSLAPQLVDQLPAWIVSEYRLAPLSEAVMKVHFPSSLEESEQGRRRLAFDELFLLQLAALRRRADWRSAAGASAQPLGQSLLEGFLSYQPFSLTGAQTRVIGEILSDLEVTQPMTRLLQGEVGSGKTIVAAVALLAALANGKQAALMAPTEILAEQHGRTLRATFDCARGFLAEALGRDVRLEVLTSASRKADRQRVYEGAADGTVDVVIGTQALIQESLGFRRLGLAVIDEQHRFGVAQRTALREKGGTPHLLVMTATPIPRTLALTLYGDLDLSVIDEMPPGRQKVRTHLLGSRERPLAYEHIRREVSQGRQAFIICPLVEDSPHLEVRAATAEYERLRGGELAGLQLALLHGKMRPAEKDQIMLDFRRGIHEVLVSTSVVEVGIDVPNATVIVVDGAERFGLAQLHQFRGRVGRGQHPSSCILLTDSQEEAVLERLRMVASVADGFQLAEEDMKLRGPGEYLGVRQSGFPAFRMADLADVGFVEMARKAASQLLARDPELSLPEHRGLAVRVEELQRVGNS